MAKYEAKGKPRLQSVQFKSFIDCHIDNSDTYIQLVKKILVLTKHADAFKSPTDGVLIS